MGFRGSLRADFDKTIDQSNVNGFSWILFSPLIIKNKLPPHVRSHRPPYLLVWYTSFVGNTDLVMLHTTNTICHIKNKYTILRSLQGSYIDCRLLTTDYCLLSIDCWLLTTDWLTAEGRSHLKKLKNLGQSPKKGGGLTQTQFLFRISFF